MSDQSSGLDLLQQKLRRSLRPQRMGSELKELMR